MIPIQDVVPPTRAPLATIGLIGLNAVVFVHQLATAAGSPVTTALWLFSHSGVAHFVLNMLFLWLFGDNVEDRLGRRALVACYAVCGAAGGVTHWMVAGHGLTPDVTSSAAVAGVVGAYFVLLPQSRVLVLSPVPLSLHEVPALFFLVMFWVLQAIIFVVTPTATRSPSSAAGAMIALTVAFACGALVAVMRRQPIRW